jgi:hypothetical protein
MFSAIDSVLYRTLGAFGSLDFAYIGQMAGNTTISRAFTTIALFRELFSWLAWAAILIGLFLFWKAQSTRSAASEA